MRKRGWPGLSVLLAIGLAAVAGGPAELPAAGAGTTSPRALIIHQGPASRGYSETAVLRSLLSHFRVQVDLMPASSYRPGKVEGYPAVFFFGGEAKSPPPARLVADLSAGRQTIVLVGGRLATLGGSEALRTAGIEKVREGTQPESWTLSFGGQSHAETWALPEVTLVSGGRAQVVAWARRADRAGPAAGMR